jgi:hypothetical protein
MAETTPPWRLVTPAQLKQGWVELRGVTPVHHNYIVLHQRDDGNYVVRNPELYLLEHPIKEE